MMSIKLSIRFMVTLTIVGLLGCEGGSMATATSDARDFAAQPASAPLDSSSLSGPLSSPHGGYHPHANLTPDKHVQVALQHLAESRFAQGMDTLSQAISQYPDAAEPYGVRGSVWLEQGNVTAALMDLESAVKLAPDNPLYLTNRAQAYRKFNRVAEALVDLNRAIELDTTLFSAYFNRGAILFNQKDFDTALADFDYCISVAPHTAAPYFNRAALYEAMGHRDLAVADLKRFIQIAPSEQWKTVANALLLEWESVTEHKAS